MMVLICRECGNAFGALGANAKFCPDCRAKKGKKRSPSSVQKTSATEITLPNYNKKGGLWQWETVTV